MIIKATPEQITKLKKRAAPINLRGLSVDDSGKLLEGKGETFEELLAQRIVQGYAVIWGQANSHGERFVKGAFAKSISDLGPNSNSNYKIKFRDRHGKSVSLMAELEEDEIGLRFKTKPLDNVQWADDLLEQLRTGTINNFSIGFRYIWDKIEYDDETDELIMLEARLFEISGVDIPSDMETFAIRAAEDEETLLDETEAFIETLGRPMQLEARHLFSKYKALIDAEPLEQRRKALKERNEQPTTKKINYRSLISKI